MPAPALVKEEQMKRRTETHPTPPPTDGRRRVARETLRSGRIVHIDRIVDTLGCDTLVVRVGGDDGWAAEILPVRSFPFFGKTLARRIREAIVKLDRPIEESGPDAVEQAVDAALFSGNEIDGDDGATFIRREPPLIPHDLPPPPPPNKR